MPKFDLSWGDGGPPNKCGGVGVMDRLRRRPPLEEELKVLVGDRVFTLLPCLNVLGEM